MKLPKIKGVPNTIDDILNWVDKQTNKVIGRLPELKKELALFDDRSNELYNIDPSELRLMSKVHREKILRGEYDSATESFISQIELYSENNFEQLREKLTNERIEDFLEYIPEMNGLGIYDEDGNELTEYDYVMELIEQMSPQDLYNFTRSKFFVQQGYPPSEGVIEFMDMYGVTPATANLENYARMKGYNVRNIFTEQDTRNKRGRPKSTK